MSSLPNINSPRIHGVRPQRPVQYRIAASGAKPMRYHAEPLPAGLSIDELMGVIRGTVAEAGTYEINLCAENDHGRAEMTLTLKAGHEICLTPPLGWNSWNCFAEEVSQEKVLASAQAMVSSGLADYGWEYVNIDGCWQDDGRGGEHGAILPHPERFPDMKLLCDEIHALGLKAGIYSTPWVADYGGNIGGSAHTPDGSDWRRKIKGGDWAAQWPVLIRDHYHGPYKFDYHDAAQWSDWGIDYLKYDWSPIDLDSVLRMWRALDMSGRDIVLSLSNNCPRSIAPDVGVYANVWRTTGDLHDIWATGSSPQTGQVQGLLNVWQQHHFWQPYTRTGHFADPDMLVVGEVRWGETGRTRLTEDEQRTHVGLWALFAAPLLIGTPLDSLDAFTLSLLTNADILAVNQDALGLQDKPVVHEEDREVMVKPLANGDLAVGFFNKSGQKLTVECDWPTLGLEGPCRVKNLWTGESDDNADKAVGYELPAHGSRILRLTHA